MSQGLACPSLVTHGDEDGGGLDGDLPGHAVWFGGSSVELEHLAAEGWQLRRSQHKGKGYTQLRMSNRPGLPESSPTDTERRGRAGT